MVQKRRKRSLNQAKVSVYDSNVSSLLQKPSLYLTPFFSLKTESINQLAEMGFSREHATEALEMSGTNRVEIAMEYALTVR